MIQILPTKTQNDQHDLLCILDIQTVFLFDKKKQMLSDGSYIWELVAWCHTIFYILKFTLWKLLNGFFQKFCRSSKKFPNCLMIGYLDSSRNRDDVRTLVQQGFTLSYLSWKCYCIGSKLHLLLFQEVA